MKRYMYLAVMMLLVALPMQSKASELFIKIGRAGSYKVQFADQMQITPSNTYRFFDLLPGTYTLTVSDPVSNLVYYTSTITLTQGYRSVYEIDAYGTLRYVTALYVSYTTWYQESPGQVVYPQNPFPQNPFPQNPFPQNPSYPNTPVITYNTAMDGVSFSQLKTTVSGQTWDSDKLSIMRQTLGTNYLTADQIAQIANLFTWDTERLTFAKEAYNRCTDKNNYFKVTATFKWSSDIESLQNYINSQP